MIMDTPSARAAGERSEPSSCVKVPAVASGSVDIGGRVSAVGITGGEDGQERGADGGERWHGASGMHCGLEVRRLSDRSASVRVFGLSPWSTLRAPGLERSVTHLPLRLPPSPPAVPHASLPSLIRPLHAQHTRTTLAATAARLLRRSGPPPPPAPSPPLSRLLHALTSHAIICFTSSHRVGHVGLLHVQAEVLAEPLQVPTAPVAPVVGPVHLPTRHRGTRAAWRAEGRDACER